MQLTTLDYIGIFTFVAFLIGYGWLAYKFGRQDQSTCAAEFQRLAESQAVTIKELESQVRKAISNTEHASKNYAQSILDLIDTRKEVSSLRKEIDKQAFTIQKLNAFELSTDELNNLWDVVRTLNNTSAIVNAMNVPLEAKRQTKLAKTIEQIILKRQTTPAVA